MKATICFFQVVPFVILLMTFGFSIKLSAQCGDCSGNGGIFLTEFSYNPSAAQGNDSDCEYIELFNGFSNTVDISGLTFTSGINFTFPASTTIMPGEYIIIAVNSTTIGSCVGYNIPAGTQIFQFGSGSLGNGGEALELEYTCAGDATSSYMIDATFDDDIADGDGDAYYIPIDGSAAIGGLPTPGAGDCTGCTDALYCCIAYDDVAMLCVDATIAMVGPGAADATTPYATSDAAIATIDAMGMVTGVAAGTVTITYTDENGCMATAEVTVVNCCDAPTLSAVITNTCSGLSQGDIDLTTIGGAGTFTYAWSNSSATEDLTDVTLGTYSVIVTVNGDSDCTVTGSYDITEFTAPTIEDASVCTGSTVSMPGLGAGAATNQYTSSDTDIATIDDNGEVTGIEEGITTITYVDENGCEATAVITVYPLPDILFHTTENSCDNTCANTISLDLTDLLLPGSYAWTGPSAFTSDMQEIGGVDQCLEAGTYSLTFTDANGCENTAQIEYDPTVCNFDLALTKEYTTTGVVTPTDEITFDITIVNQGDVEAYDVDVLDYFPAACLTYGAAAYASHSAGTTAPTVTDNGAGAFTIASIPADEDVIVTLTFTIDASCTETEITNNAEIVGGSLSEGGPDAMDSDSTPADDSTSPPDPDDNDVDDDMGGDDFDPATFIICQSGCDFPWDGNE